MSVIFDKLLCPCGGALELQGKCTECGKFTDPLVKERPILFSGEMVCAILEGRKTQTRRVIKPQPAGEWAAPGRTMSPYGKTGDRLWVRESFAGDDCMGALYRADFKSEEAAKLKTGELDDGEWCYRSWTPSIHMPRSLSRITLEITNVRVERLRDISGADAILEGIRPNLETTFGLYGAHADAKAKFATLWDVINGKKHPWASNPWVWVIEFKRLTDGEL